MAREYLDDDTRLEIALSATISRHQYDEDASALIAELRERAGTRTYLLAEVAGSWAGYHEHDPHTRAVVGALLDVPGATRWAQAGAGSVSRLSPEGTTNGRRPNMIKP